CLAFLGDRDLVDREVVVLHARGDDLVEARGDPHDVLGGEAELGRDRVGDRGLVALPARGGVVDDPRLVGGVGGADRELALGDRLERRRGVGRGGLGAARGRLGVGGRARGERKDARGGQGGRAGGQTHRGLLGGDATRSGEGRGYRSVAARPQRRGTSRASSSLCHVVSRTGKERQDAMGRRLANGVKTAGLFGALWAVLLGLWAVIGDGSTGMLAIFV